MTSPKVTTRFTKPLIPTPGREILFLFYLTWTPSIHKKLCRTIQETRRHGRRKLCPGWGKYRRLENRTDSYLSAIVPASGNPRVCAGKICVASGAPRSGCHRRRIEWMGRSVRPRRDSPVRDQHILRPETHRQERLADRTVMEQYVASVPGVGSGRSDARGHVGD